MDRAPSPAADRESNRVDPDLALGAYEGAHPPDRDHEVDARGVTIAVHEWGDVDAPPLFLVHGGFDFARTFDVFAPLLASAGWRVVSWDQRGHGDSEHTELYSWEADLRDASAVMESVTLQPAPVIGHSKGGALMLQLADAQPFRFSHLVNLDGLPYRRPIPDAADHERTAMLATEVEAWLDLRRVVSRAMRRSGTVDELARRRAKMNPRLDGQWLRHLVTVGGRHDHDGWRWKVDPQMRMGGFGPWRPEWTIARMPGLAMPFLAILGSKPEPMGFGTSARQVEKFVPEGGRVETLDDAGHFVHIERPGTVARLVLDFIGESTGSADRRG